MAQEECYGDLPGTNWLDRKMGSAVHRISEATGCGNSRKASEAPNEIARGKEGDVRKTQPRRTVFLHRSGFTAANQRFGGAASIFELMGWIG